MPNEYTTLAFPALLTVIGTSTLSPGLAKSNGTAVTSTDTALLTLPVSPSTLPSTLNENNIAAKTVPQTAIASTNAIIQIVLLRTVIWHLLVIFCTNTFYACARYDCPSICRKSQKKCQTTKTCNLATGWLGEPLWLCVITLRLFCYFQIDMVSAKPSHETFTYVLYLFASLCQLFASNYPRSVQNLGKLAVKMPQSSICFCIFAAKLSLGRANGKTRTQKRDSDIRG